MDFAIPTLCSTLIASFAFVVLRTWRISRTRRSRLRSLPGPKGLPFIGNVFDINISAPWLTYTEWGKRYGGIVHCTLFGRDFVIINEKKIVHELLELRGAIYADRPSLSFIDFFGLDFNTAIKPYGKRWRLHRKMFNLAFNKRASMTYKPIQMQKVRQMLQKLVATPQDYVKHAEAFSGSVIMAISYGYNSMPEDDPFVSKAMRHAELVINVVTTERAAIYSALPILSYIPSWLPGGRYKKWAGHIRALGREVRDEPVNYVKQNMSSDSVRNSLVNLLLARDIARDESCGHEEVVKEAAATAFLAAQDTTFSVMLVFILAMIRYPEVQIKAQEEIDRVVGQDRLPDFSDREILPYVQCVFIETMRWKPVAPLAVPHATLSDDIYDGMYVPKGSTVLINTWAITQNEEHYPNPTVFIPERHLNADGKFAEDSVPVFGFGRRICPGRHLADQSVWSLMVSILATLHITKAKDELGNEIDVQPEFTTGIVVHPKPFPCCIKPRSAKAEQLIRESNTVDE
ncbi:hypothetical protein SCLCIDRAFT_1096223 [Scleroderma citrinum Foug A]|uniref:Cytochrome P450 n=1 Tax=Scleroderma citrinum Foug A TaxID=1036808 RepID=A0A0C3DCC8_9AGAM|nr:hypothetical protein SCLCIDRAFT_1096223 [Scleroderma citrinum Foug A]